MEDLTKRFQRIDWKGLQRQATKVRASTASALKDLVMTDVENKVRAATADTTWGASASDLGAIAQWTYNREDFVLIMHIIWTRLNSSRWRCRLKALDLLKHLICFGSSRVLEESKAVLYHLQSMENYHYIDKETGRDHGTAVREKARLVCQLLTDERFLEEYKREDQELRTKVTRAGAISSEDYQFGSRFTPSVSAATRPPYDTSYGDAPDTTGSSTNFLPHRPYDDVPSAPKPDRSSFGGFGSDGGQPAAKQPSIDDLLGGGGEVTGDPLMGKTEVQKNQFADDEAGEDDDDDFNPRAIAAAAKGKDEIGNLDDLLAGIPDNEGIQGGLGGSKKHVDDEEIGWGLSKLQIGKEETEQGSAVNTKADEDVAFGGLVHFDNILLGKKDRVEPRKPVHRIDGVGGAPKKEVPVASMREKEVQVPRVAPKVDPFADLLPTAKKSGVL